MDKKILPEKKDITLFLKDLFFIILGCSAGGFATVAIMLPNGLTAGGLTGIVRLITVFIPIKFSIIYYFASFCIVMLVFITLGMKEMRKILLLSFIYPGVLFIFENMDIKLLGEKDILLAAVFFGIFSGLCIGIVFGRGYVFSGTAALAKILRIKVFPQISQTKILLAIDAGVIIASAFAFGRNIALYALITQVISWKTTDLVIYGFVGKVVQLEVITHDEAGPIIEYIINDLHRGVSSEKVIGEYTKERFTKLRVLCSPREMVLMKRAICKLDSKALVTVIQLENIWGKGFKNISDDR